MASSYITQDIRSQLPTTLQQIQGHNMFINSRTAFNGLVLVWSKMSIFNTQNHIIQHGINMHTLRGWLFSTVSFPMCNLLYAWKLKESLTLSLFELEELYIPHLAKSPDTGFVFHSLQLWKVTLSFWYRAWRAECTGQFFFHLWPWYSWEGIWKSLLPLTKTITFISKNVLLTDVFPILTYCESTSAVEACFGSIHD